jgi:hypothetical protein
LRERRYRQAILGVGRGRSLDAGHVGLQPDQIIRRDVRPESRRAVVRVERKK